MEGRAARDLKAHKSRSFGNRWLMSALPPIEADIRRWAAMSALCQADIGGSAYWIAPLARMG